MKQYNEDDIVNLFEARKYRTFEKKLERYTYLSGS